MTLSFDALTAMSLIYVFVFSYNGVILQKIEAFHKITVPPEAQAKNYRRHSRQRMFLAFALCIPFNLLNLLIVMISAPTIIGIAKNHAFGLADPDLGVTLFVIIFSLTVVNMISTFFLTKEIFRK